MTQSNVRAFAAQDSTIYAGTYKGVFLSTDHGGSWSDVSAGMTYKFVLSMAGRETSVFAGTSGGVQRSTDNGVTWNVINAGLTNPNVYALHVSGPDLFAGTSGGGVFRSTDDGANWEEVNGGLTNNVVFAMTSVVTGGGDTALFCGTSGSGVFRSTDRGDNWTPVNNGLGLNFLGTLTTVGSNVFAGGPVNGAYVSTDFGDSWSPVNTGLTSMSVNALAPGPNPALVGSLVAGTLYGGAWQRPLWQMVLVDTGYDVKKGWNIVSLPLSVDDPRASEVFPSAISPAFEFEASYVERDSLRAGTGYWLKFDHDHRIPDFRRQRHRRFHRRGGGMEPHRVDQSPGPDGGASPPTSPAPSRRISSDTTADIS